MLLYDTWYMIHGRIYDMIQYIIFICAGYQTWYDPQETNIFGRWMVRYKAYISGSGMLWTCFWFQDFLWRKTWFLVSLFHHFLALVFVIRGMIHKRAELELIISSRFGHGSCSWIKLAQIGGSGLIWPYMCLNWKKSMNFEVIIKPMEFLEGTPAGPGLAWASVEPLRISHHLKPQKWWDSDEYPDLDLPGKQPLLVNFPQLETPKTSNPVA